MGSLFSKNKSRVTAHDKAILQLKQQRDKLKQYQKKVELNMEKERQLARTLLQDGRKERAKLLLRKKKFQEQQLHKADGQLENLEKLVNDLEFASIELQVLDGLKVGNEALKKVHEVLNVDEVEKILEETREGIEKQREIDELLNGALTQEDEDDVEAELSDIIKGSLPEVPMEPVEIEGLPEVPTELPREERAKERRRKEKVALEAS